ncbi:MAG: RHS repeat protein, partial [Lachnospiraceae bacterium]|nr:RHS repeat protein [Lachnospiraceae bacterium]
MVLPNGSTSEWSYDFRGNCLSHTGPMGAVEAYTYDKLNRLVKAKLSDGNEVSLAYNSYEEVVLAKDNDSEIAFTY